MKAYLCFEGNPWEKIKSDRMFFFPTTESSDLNIDGLKK